MNDNWSLFEAIVRNSNKHREPLEAEVSIEHPFTVRDIHQKLPPKVKRLFDDAHFAEATFEAFKYLENCVKSISKQDLTGVKLMSTAFSDNHPLIKIGGDSKSDTDIQKGYMHLFMGSISAIRNPRGHEHSFYDTYENCLDFLSLASFLLRSLEKAGNKLE